MNAVPETVKLYTPRAGTEFIRDVTASEDASGVDVLLGLFRDDAGGRYFMPVNFQRERDRGADELTVTVTINLTPSIRQLGKLSRSSGQSELLTIHNQTLAVTLPGGTGDLFKIGDADFPGL